ncbi:hypothetical protein [Streptomyces sp. NPDC001292]|uniref:hypothetical protein n=1 Tax=Streptomyces sp. NPDC001292 TaxID=3364558 RepID=UPI0036B0A6BB
MTGRKLDAPPQGPAGRRHRADGRSRWPKATGGAQLKGEGYTTVTDRSVRITARTAKGIHYGTSTLP